MKRLRAVFATILLCTTSSLTMAQIEHPWEKYLHELSTIEDEESSFSESTFAELTDLEEHPININTATREDLARLPFLNEKQIEDICEYLYRYHGMRTLGELQMIESLDYYRRHILQYFIYAGDSGKKKFPTLKEILKYGKNNLLFSTKIPFYSHRGDENGYLGYKYKHSFRYTFNYGEYIKAGMIGTQDAGEPFLSNKNYLGYDHYSYYLLIRNTGRIKTLALGCYRLSFGMGLVLNHNFSMGKMITLYSLERSNNDIRANSSRTDANYFQGVAVKTELTKGLDLTGFVSYRKLDGTMQHDSTISSIITNGYHRTATEMDKKHNFSSTVIGGNIHYFNQGFHIGTTAVYTSLDKSLNPNTSVIYRIYDARGSNFYNISTDYGYIGHRFSFNGETAVDAHRAMATINCLSYHASENADIIALQRYYSKKYTSLYANSFSEGGNTKNENGIYIGVNWRLNHSLNIIGYTDYAYFAWPRYQVSRSSHAFDNMISTTYHDDKWSILVRYRLKAVQKDSQGKDGLTNQIQHRGRISAHYSPNKNFRMLTQADIVYTEYHTNEKGWMMNENINYNMGDWMQLNANIGYFNTSSYESRIYTYEKGLLYDFSFPMFYGEGIRYALMAKAKIGDKLLLTTKIGTTDYFDRSSIGNSYQTIYKSAITDLEMQLKWKF